MLVKLSIILFSISYNFTYYAHRFNFTYYSQNYAWFNARMALQTANNIVLIK